MSRKKQKRPQQMRPFGWRAAHRWRCDFCDAKIHDVRVKLTSSSGGFMFIACAACGLKAMGG